jgi:hypothetical protein
MKTYAFASISWLALAIAAHAQSFSGDPSANQIYAGPTSGPAAPAQFRSMVTGDIPAGTVANSNLANMAAGMVKCQPAGGSAGAPQDCSYPTINAVDYGASGSTTSTTGTISGSSSSLSLASAIDFKNGQGIRINGAGATFSTNPPTGLSVTQHGTTGSTSYQYQVASLDAHGGVGAAVTAVSISNGNATLSSTNFITVSWTAPGLGPTPSAYAVYGKTSGSMTLLQIVNGATSWNDVGTTTSPGPDWLPSSPPSSALNDYLLTTISSGAGTTSLILAANATNGVSGATVDHDDTTAIKNAIAGLPNNGGVVLVPAGTYQFTSPLVLGNGNGTTASTTSGMVLYGLGSRCGVNGISGTLPICAVNFRCLVYTICMEVAGPINGWGIQNASIDLTQIGGSNSFGLFVLNGSFGFVENLFVTSSYNIAIIENVGTHPANDNQWSNVFIFMPANAPNAQGIHISGTSTNDIFQERWFNLHVIPGTSSTTVQCLYLGALDSIKFKDFNCNPVSGGAVGIIFDYSVNSAWPAGVDFDGVELYSNSISNNSTPTTSGINLNRMRNFSRVNGATVPYLANLSVEGYFDTGGNAPTLSGCSGSGSSIGTNSTNDNGVITGQTSATTSCTVTFATPVTWSGTPNCIVTPQISASGAQFISAISSSAFTFTFPSTANYKFSYLCRGS